MEYKKLIRDGKIGVIISPEFGAGWSTWADNDEREAMLFDSRIIEKIESNKLTAEDMTSWGYKSYIGSNIQNLEINWLPVGTAFKVHEYDGSESLEIRDLIDWYIA